MGLIRGTFQLLNPLSQEQAPLEESAVADTRAVHLCIPVHVALQLQQQDQL